VVVDLFFKKPYCSVEKKLVSSRNSKISFRIIFSNSIQSEQVKDIGQ
jgi:hypothetical protein